MEHKTLNIEQLRDLNLLDDQPGELERVMSFSADAGESIGEEWESFLDLGLVGEARKIRKVLEATGLLEKGYPSNPEFKSHNWRGLEYTVEGKPEEALKALSAAAKCAKSPRERYSSLANQVSPLIQLKRYDEAKKTAAVALELAKIRAQEESTARITLQNAFFNALCVEVMETEDLAEQKRRDKAGDEILVELRETFPEELKTEDSQLFKLLEAEASLEFMSFQVRSKIWPELEIFFDAATQNTETKG